MKMFTKLLLLTALLAQQTALFATTARMEAAEMQANAVTEVADAAGIWEDFDLKVADELFGFSNAFHCTKPGASTFSVTETLKMGGLSNKDLKQTPTLSVFPNPTKGMVKISLTNGGTEVYKIRISNTIGKVVRTIEPADIAAAGNSGVEVDLTNLPPGIYFYSLMVNEKMVETKRLVLQN